MPAPVRVVVAHPDRMVRDLLRSVCRPPRVHVVAETAAAGELVPLVDAEQPDVVLTDHLLDGGSLAELIAPLLERSVRVLVLTGDPSPELLTELLASGAAGYLLLDSAPGAVVDAIEAVACGGAALHPSAASTILEQWRRLRAAPDVTADGMPARRIARSTPAGHGELTRRELEVLQAMSDGLTTKAIARRLGVAVKTVENHKIRVFDKLGVRSHAQAVSVAIGHALLAPATAAAAPVVDLNTTVDLRGAARG